VFYQWHTDFRGYSGFSRINTIILLILSLNYSIMPEKEIQLLKTQIDKLKARDFDKSASHQKIHQII